jgi:hypothetical protein
MSAKIIIALISLFLTTPVFSSEGKNKCLSFVGIKAGCKNINLKKLYSEMVALRNARKDEFVTQSQHEKNIDKSYSQLWSKYEDANGYIYYRGPVDNNFTYNPDNQAWELGRDGGLSILIDSRSEDVVYGNAYQKVNGKNISLNHLKIAINKPIHIIMEPDVAKAFKNNGQVLVACKRLNQSHPIFSGTRNTPTIARPYEVYSLTYQLPHEATDVVLFINDRVVYRYSVILSEPYEDYSASQARIKQNAIEHANKITEIFVSKISSGWVDENQNNPLHLAVWNNDIKMLDSVPRDKLDLFQATNKFGSTPIELAKDKPGILLKLKEIGVIQ